MLLEVKSISKKYKDQPVLNAVHFTVDRGEIVGFLGPNGAGKSTTMKIIAGCIYPDKGKVLIDGYDVSTEEPEAKSRIGYLPEDNPLYDEMYVPEYLEYVAGLYPSVTSVKETVSKTIRKVGLTPEAHKVISKLSKGYRQRVGLAQAIIHNPELLILDEPGSGLDPNQMDEVRELLTSLSKNKAILFSSHTLQEVSAFCSRVIIIHKGSIVADQPLEEIKNLEQYFKELTR